MHHKMHSSPDEARKLELCVDVGVCWSEGVDDQVTVNSTGFCVVVVVVVGGWMGTGFWIVGVGVWGDCGKGWYSGVCSLVVVGCRGCAGGVCVMGG